MAVESPKCQADNKDMVRFCSNCGEDPGAGQKLLVRFWERGEDECLLDHQTNGQSVYVVALPLDHAEKEQVVFRIYPEPGARAANPNDGARCCQHANVKYAILIAIRNKGETLMALNNLYKKLISERLQYLVFIGLSLGVAGLAGISYFSNNVRALSGFRRFLDGLNPLAGVFFVFILAIFLLSRLLSRGWFYIYKSENLKGLSFSSILAAIFALIIILLESARVVVFPADLNIRFPASLLFYPVIGYMAEIIFHVLPLSLLLFFLTSVSKKIGYRKIIWPCLLIIALLEPILQTILGFSAQYSLGTNLYGNFLHIYLINIFQLAIFKRYDFISMYWFRLVYYLLWHIVWGALRLNLLF